MILSFPTWRLVIDEHAGQLAQALADELGPIRALDVVVTTTDNAVVATITSGDPDAMTVAWWAVVNLSAFWASGGLMGGVDVGTVVEVAGQRIATSAAGMRAIADGCDRGAWEPVVEGRAGLRVVRLIT